jgi:hypothetical protein
MSDLSLPFESSQRELCLKYGTQYIETKENEILGFATSTKGLLPINGLRHPVQGNTCGWYIWCGEKFSEDPKFFAPLCAKHFYEGYPEVARYLGLPPGHRFLVAGDQIDVWYDPTLLKV